MTRKTRIAALAIATGVALSIASGAYATVKEYIEMFDHAFMVMKDGTKVPVDIVKMNGHTMVMIREEDLPDYLHQQVFKVMDHR